MALRVEKITSLLKLLPATFLESYSLCNIPFTLGKWLLLRTIPLNSPVPYVNAKINHFLYSPLVFGPNRGSLMRHAPYATVHVAGHGRQVNLDSSRKMSTVIFKCDENKGLLTANLAIMTPVRGKSKKGSKNQRQNDSDEEEEVVHEIEVDNADLPSTVKEIIGHLPSLRLDIVAKSGFGLSRSNVEKIFYESRLRINGERALKKSVDLSLGDEVDLVRGVNSENDQFLDVTRIQIFKVKIPSNLTGNVVVTMRRSKLLTIENYADPWSGSDYSK